MSLRVDRLWRYPVKSMAGEPLDETELTDDGIPGDRVIHVRGPEGVRTSRRHYRLLGLHATTAPNGDVLVNGLRWDSDEVAALVRDAAGKDAWLDAYDGIERFDVLPLLVATDGAIAAVGEDSRRFRPNLLLEGVPGLAERVWEGKRLRIGSAVVRAVTLRRRCIMTTFDPDTAAQDVEVLLKIQRDFAGTLALDTEVLEPGHVRLGDQAVLLD